MKFYEPPHSGYHWDYQTKRFFEGWYFRVTLPELQDNFAFMYSIEDPIGNQPHSGGAVQIMGLGDEYLWRTFPRTDNFWASGDRLALGHWQKRPPHLTPQPLAPAIFERTIPEGYQATPTLNQGSIRDPATGKICRWHYTTRPVYGWGIPSTPTGNWYSFLPIYDPGWQVLLAHGLSSGWIEWQGQRYQFTDAPSYSEKNWGRSFPQQWFWVNCNAFPDIPDLALTAVGAIRNILNRDEEVGLIGIHHQGEFFEFAPWNSHIHWQVSPWGEWRMQATHQKGWQVELEAETNYPGQPLRAPTHQGLQFCCRDTLRGQVQLKLYQNRVSPPSLQARSPLCGVEVGGQEWTEDWVTK